MTGRLRIVVLAIFPIIHILRSLLSRTLESVGCVTPQMSVIVSPFLLNVIDRVDPDCEKT